MDKLVDLQIFGNKIKHSVINRLSYVKSQLSRLGEAYSECFFCFFVFCFFNDMVLHKVFFPIGRLPRPSIRWK